MRCEQPALVRGHDVGAALSGTSSSSPPRRAQPGAGRCSLRRLACHCYGSRVRVAWPLSVRGRSRDGTPTGCGRPASRVRAILTRCSSRHTELPSTGGRVGALLRIALYTALAVKPILHIQEGRSTSLKRCARHRRTVRPSTPRRSIRQPIASVDVALPTERAGNSPVRSPASSRAGCPGSSLVTSHPSRSSACALTAQVGPDVLGIWSRRPSAARSGPTCLITPRRNRLAGPNGPFITGWRTGEDRW